MLNANLPEFDPNRLSTGISGLDEVLLGGLPPERVYLVEGTPGAGKTTLALQFLLEAQARGEKSLYITLSEGEDELNAVAHSHGWSLEGITIFELIDDAGLDSEAEQSVLHPSELELGETVRRVIERVEALGPTRVIFDSLSELRLLAQSPLRYRRQVLALKHFFTQRGCTVLLLDDRTLRREDLQLHSVAHGVLTLEQLPIEFGSERRRLRVVKLRGAQYRGGFHDFVITPGGLEVYPRLVAQEHAAEFVNVKVSTGSEGLDSLLGGGLVPGTNALLIGPSGAGKTTIATCAIHTALGRGDRAALFLFDEGAATLLDRSATLGLDLRPYVANGQLILRQVDPAEMSPGAFAALVRQAVQRDGAKMVVVDSLNAYLQSMPGEKYLLLQMHELLTYLNHRGVVTVMILGQHGLIGDMRSTIDVSYLADTIVLLRFFETEGEVRKAISVLKTRTAAHERTIREFSVGHRGVFVGAPVQGFRGVLSGMPAWEGDRSDLLGADAQTSLGMSMRPAG